MPAFRDYTGHKFGSLTVIEPVPGKGPTRWRCQCSCGKLVTVRRTNLTKTKSCGCTRYPTGSEHPLWTGEGEIHGVFWNHVQRGAHKRGLPITLTIQDAWALFEAQGRQCALSGLPLSFAAKSKNRSRDTTASLDRIDSSKGYVPGNVQWVHKDVNRLKSDRPESEFWNLIEILYANRPSKDQPCRLSVP